MEKNEAADLEVRAPDAMPRYCSDEAQPGPGKAVEVLPTAPDTTARTTCRRMYQPMVATLPQRIVLTLPATYGQTPGALGVRRPRWSLRVPHDSRRRPDVSQQARPPVLELRTGTPNTEHTETCGSPLRSIFLSITTRVTPESLPGKQCFEHGAVQLHTKVFACIRPPGAKSMRELTPRA